MNWKIIAGFFVTLVIAVVIFVVALNSLNREEDVTSSVVSTPITEHIEGNSTITLYRRGRIIANEEHRGYRIQISATSRQLETLSGYDNTVINKYVFDNNAEAYEEFIYALNGLGLNGVANKDNFDTRGICPTGNIYSYSMMDDGEEIVWQWVSTCGTSTTNAGGLSAMFHAQIPEFGRLTNDLRL